MSICNAYYERFKQLTSSLTIDNEQIEWTRKELREHLEDCISELKDLEGTVNIVEMQPNTYKISPSEIQNRRKFIDDTKTQLNKISKHINEYTPTNKYESFSKKKKEERQQLLSGSNRESTSYKDRYDFLDEQVEKDNEAFIQQQMSRQRDIIEEQDKNLDRVIEGTSRLKNLVLDIGDELDSHAIIIEDLNTEVTRTNTSINRASRRLDKLIKAAKGDKGKLLLIVILFIILAVLILLVAFL